ncbi:MAG: protein-export chaperone SecB [Alphaproteobacteria bacterium]|nr:protein-export chaperone SecB [Alphaproteobacteria bacterium]
MKKEKETKKAENKEKKEEAKQTVAPLQIHTQYIKDLSFEAPGMPFLGAQIKEPPKVNIGIDLNAACVNKEEKLFTVEMELKIHANADDKVVFICELTYGALVTLNVPDEHIQPLLLIEVPHLMFPYVRSIVANTTRESGMVPLTLSPIDFAALYRSRILKEQEKKAN